jgi:septal ring factor EnvC (AmiA/AmiB activator)
MDISSVTGLITNLGFPIALVLILLYFIIKYINKKDEQNREDTKQQISALRRENKEDKKLFESAINSFNISVQEFKKVQQETTSIKSDLVEVKQDLLIIKTKMEK